MPIGYCPKSSCLCFSLLHCIVSCHEILTAKCLFSSYVLPCRLLFSFTWHQEHHRSVQNNYDKKAPSDKGLQHCFSDCKSVLILCWGLGSKGRAASCSALFHQSGNQALTVRTFLQAAAAERQTAELQFHQYSNSDRVAVDQTVKPLYPAPALPCFNAAMSPCQNFNSS